MDGRSNRVLVDRNSCNVVGKVTVTSKLSKDINIVVYDGNNAVVYETSTIIVLMILLVGSINGIFFYGLLFVDTYLGFKKCFTSCYPKLVVMRINK